jgi:serine phosphatase RsbU (regulator of sigma subunit)
MRTPGTQLDVEGRANVTSPAHRKRGLSIGTRLAVTNTLVIAVAFALLAQQLTTRERARLLESKAEAANMVGALVAASLSAPVDFGDSDDIRPQLDNLRANLQISAASVYSADHMTLLGEWRRASGAPLAALGDDENIRYGVDALTVQRNVVGRKGNVIARVTIAFSLAAENREYRNNRIRILVAASVFASALAALLIFLSGYQIVRPLQRMVDVARRLEDGDLNAHVDREYSGEIGALARALNTMGRAVAERHERLAREVELAERIQTSILPRNPQVVGLDISAAMLPASEVGGDYYDVLPAEDGCWLGIGDVSGHGLNAGLIMLMMQSMVSVLTRRDSDAAPREIVAALNSALFDSVRSRLDMQHHATLTLLRYRRSGRVAFAGAHEEILVYRAATGRCDVIDTPGTWVAAVSDISKATVDSTFQLCSGDLLVLHTDGVTEGRNAEGTMFGVERLCSEVERVGAGSAREVQTHVVETVKRWTHAQDDDITVLVAKYHA